VLDDDLRPVHPGSGVVGRLATTGRIPLGYHRDEEKTAKTFVEVDGVRWVLPGDMATVEADGSVTVFGRGSLVVNTGGEKVYPEEVELALVSHPEVVDALVVGLPDDHWGERVVAVLEPVRGCRPSVEDLAAHCASQVARYKLPREVHLVDRVRRSPAGKGDYRWAKAVAAASAAATEGRR
jgi:acyl-CoA synthetase (AMP-forming)/AMP-acid ligase II